MKHNLKILSFSIILVILSFSCGNKTSFVPNSSGQNDSTSASGTQSSTTNNGSQTSPLRLIEELFVISDAQSTNFKFNLLSSKVFHDFTLTEGNKVTRDFKAVHLTDPVDILVVVDNSGSMKEEQENLAARMEPLLSHFADKDWRIAVTTTDPVLNPAGDCTKTHRTLIESTDSPEIAQQKFRAAINAGINGSGNERGILQAVNGFACTYAGNTWLRAGSTLITLILADEDNCSYLRLANGVMVNDCGSAPHADPNYLLNYLSNPKDHPSFPGLGKKLGEDAKVYAIAKIPGDKTCTTASREGIQYKQAVDATNGLMGSICAIDYTPILSEISKNIASTVLSQFDLGEYPSVTSLKVYIGDQLVDSSKYRIEETYIKLLDQPKKDADIKIEYKLPVLNYQSKLDPNQSIFDLQSTILTDKETQDVTLQYKNGQFILSPNNFIPKATLRVSFATNETKKQEFTLAHEPIKDSLKIYMQDQECLNTMSLNGNKLSFNCNPDRSETATITYSYNQEKPKSFRFASYKPEFEKGKWKLFVDNIEKNFTRIKDTVYYDDAKNLPNGSEIKIQYQGP